MDTFGIVPPDSLAVFGAALLLGLVHGAEPGHGWPIAATYALDSDHRWRDGLVASGLLGLGHLVSSLAVVTVFFLAKHALDLNRINEPILIDDVAIGGPVGVFAGVLLVGLGIREYRRGGRGHDHPHGDGHERDR